MNFPDNTTSKDLWEVCQGYGTVVDVYIPNRKSKAGKRFAFVRFIKVENVDRLIGNLYTLWIGRMHLHANEDNILEKFKIIIHGKIFVLRAKELFVWSPVFKDVVEVVYCSDDESVKGADENNVETNPIQPLNEKETSNDPFNIYDLLKKHDKGKVNFGLDTSFPYPPGFTPEKDNLKIDVQEYSAMDVKLLWGNYNFDHTFSEAVGNSGGILCTWDSNVFHKEQHIILDNFFSLYGTWNPNKAKLLMISIYAPQSATGKRSLWSYITSLITRWNGDCMVMGDFNEVRCMKDRMGSVFNVQGANEFNNFISNSGLVKVQLEGYSFTWSHPLATKTSKLDRFLVTEGLVSLFPHISGICLDRHLSDHRPILLREVITDDRATPFWMYHSWFSWHGFEQMVTHTWNSIVLDYRNGMVRRVKEEFRSHFATRFQAPGVNRSRLNFRFPSRLNPDQVAELENPITRDEIHNAVWACGENKSPGPDGFTFEFFPVDTGIFTGIKIDSSLTISHHFYADDTVFIGEWNFFNGIQGDERKIKLSKVIASNKYGGLGVSNYYAFNRALLFKWLWRFISQDNSLWCRFITYMHGSQLLKLSPFHSLTWNTIIQEINVHKSQGVDLISHCKIRVGNGSVALSLLRTVRGGVEAHQLDLLQNLIGPAILTNLEDSWVWDLNGEGVFRVKDVRNLLDESFLPKDSTTTRWVKSIPIKINVFAWKVYLDRLRTRLNLIRRGVQVPSLSMLPDCPVDINARCPSQFALRNGAGATIGCRSACEQFGTPQYCCTGANNTPSTCPPTDYSRFFKNLCPKAYSYAFDDPTSTFTCNTGANYVITFCP
nr:RNA-directed DNA polymerase, eukaryota [Tanacetum cinerariifolium]